MAEQKFAGKVAVITGGNSGIGLATAREFGRQGAKVAIFGRDAATLEQVRKELGVSALAVRGDVAKLNDIDRLFSETAVRFGKVDALFVNAGVTKVSPAAQLSEADYDAMMSVNVKGAFFTIQKSLPHLNDGAAIVVNGSVAANLAFPGMGVYGATKAALLSLARTFGAELAERRIRVNAVNPGAIQTPIHGRLGLSQEQIEGFAKTLMGRVPLRRFGQAEEVAKVVTFLASSDASYLVNAEVNVDGGWTDFF